MIGEDVTDHRGVEAAGAVDVGERDGEVDLERAQVDGRVAPGQVPGGTREELASLVAKPSAIPRRPLSASELSRPTDPKSSNQIVPDESTNKIARMRVGVEQPVARAPAR